MSDEDNAKREFDMSAWPVRDVIGLARAFAADFAMIGPPSLVATLRELADRLELHDKAAHAAIHADR